MDDPLMERISAAIALVHAGAHAEARLMFGELWAELGPTADPFHRCTLSHFMADVQTDVRDELLWDLRALEAAEAMTDDRVKQHHASMALRAFYPSLHLNLAEDYRKLGALDQARVHVERATQALAALPEDGYGRMIRMGIARMQDQLAIGDA